MIIFGWMKRNGHCIKEYGISMFYISSQIGTSALFRVNSNVVEEALKVSSILEILLYLSSIVIFLLLLNFFLG